MENMLYGFRAAVITAVQLAGFMKHCSCRRSKREKSYAHALNFNVRNLKNYFVTHKSCHILTDERNVMLHNP